MQYSCICIEESTWLEEVGGREDDGGVVWVCASWQLLLGVVNWKEGIVSVCVCVL